AAAVDDGDAIRHRQRLALVVGHVDGRRAKPVVQLADLDLHRLAELLVERRQRLVHQHDRRLEHDGARERDALALAAGQFVDAARTVATELDGVERGLNAPCDLGRRHAAQLQRKRDVARDVHVREERVALEHEAYVALVGCEAHDLALAEAHAADVLPEPEGPSSVRNSPLRISRSTASSARALPYDFDTPRIVIGIAVRAAIAGAYAMAARRGVTPTACSGTGWRRAPRS